MVAHPHDANTIASLLEFERRMIRRRFPQLEFFACQRLYLRRQWIEAFPEPPVRFGNHGILSRHPARMSVRTSSKTCRRGPFSLKSRSICASHSALSRLAMYAESSVNSGGDNASTSFLSSVTLMRLTLSATAPVATKFLGAAGNGRLCRVCPGGRFDNSPAFQRWGEARIATSPREGG